jgi:hypothetical protein
MMHRKNIVHVVSENYCKKITASGRSYWIFFGVVLAVGSKSNGQSIKEYYSYTFTVHMNNAPWRGIAEALLFLLAFLAFIYV